MTESPLAITRDGPCALLTMNRPDQLNALSGALRRAVVAAFAGLAADESVRVVVLTGAGRAFTAGLDLKELAASGASVTDSVDAENVVSAIARFPKPVIAAVNGLAVTGGFEIALACDIVLAAEEAYFVDSHVKVGLTPGWGLSQRLPRLVGVHRAKELSLTARRIGAREAEAWGLVNHVLPADELLPRAFQTGREIAQWPASAVAGMKAIIDDGLALPLGEALRMEAARASAANAAVHMPASALAHKS
jgi:enoyl-CoA hydratase